MSYRDVTSKLKESGQGAGGTRIPNIELGRGFFVTDPRSKSVTEVKSKVYEGKKRST